VGSWSQCRALALGVVGSGPGGESPTALEERGLGNGSARRDFCHSGRGSSGGSGSRDGSPETVSEIFPLWGLDSSGVVLSFRCDEVSLATGTVATILGIVEFESAGTGGKRSNG